LLLPFSGAIDGQRFEVYISGSVSAPVGRVTYLIQANTNVSLVEEPFSLGLLGHTATGTMIGSFEAFHIPGRAITPFLVRKPSFSLSVGAIFENSAEENSASLTEFRACQAA
jgi:hypothetical protein